MRPRKYHFKGKHAPLLYMRTSAEFKERLAAVCSHLGWSAQTAMERTLEAFVAKAEKEMRRKR